MAKVIGVISAKLSPEGRIPNKVLLPLAGKTMLEHHIERMQAAGRLDGVFVATSRWPGNEQVAKIAESCLCGCIAGSEHDVIARHIALCEREEADAVIRIPCDSPLFDIDALEGMVKYYKSLWTDGAPGYIYAKGVPFECSTMPELISFKSLKMAHEFYQGPAVTLPIWEHRSAFSCAPIFVDGSIIRPEYRLAVDMPVDYVFMSHIYAALYKGYPLDLCQVYHWLDNNPHIARLNGTIEHSQINKRFLEAQKNATA